MNTPTYNPGAGLQHLEPIINKPVGKLTDKSANLVLRAYLQPYISDLHVPILELVYEPLSEAINKPADKSTHKSISQLARIP